MATPPNPGYIKVRIKRGRLHVEAQKATYPILRMCEQLEVSRSGFYKWRKRCQAAPSPAQQRRTGLPAKVAAFHKASDGTYGAPRILADLRDDGQSVFPQVIWRFFDFERAVVTSL